LEGTYTKWSLGKYYNYVEIECNNVLIPRENITEFWLSSMMNAELYYEDLIKEGWTPQQARSVLPNAVKTEIASTFNLREWRHIFKLRTGSNVHPDMGYVMQKAKDIFQEKLPLLFGDL
jgi:thymidylate synthase (FAD)